MSKSERTKAFIVETTAPVFNRHGYVGTSMAQLTKATGLTKGSIYGNFSGKDEVAIEAFRYNMSRITTKIILAIDSSESPVKQLMNVLLYYKSQFIKDFFDTGCPIVNLAPEVDDTHEVLSREVNKAIEKWQLTIERIITAGVNKSEFKESTSPSQFSKQIISCIEGGILLAKSTGNLSYLTNAIELLEELVISKKL